MGRRKTPRPSGDWTSIYRILKTLYISSFKWEGLPPSVNTRYLELQLLETGQIALFKDDTLGLLALQASLAGELDVYYEPKRVHVIGGGGYTEDLNVYNPATEQGDAVIMWNNAVRDIPKLRLMDFAKRICNAERTVDINVNAQRTPITITADKKTINTAKQMFNDYDSYEPVLITDSLLGEGTITVLKTDAPFVADKITELKKQYWHEALSYIGIPSNASEKKERLVSNEVTAASGLAIAMQFDRLSAREQAIEKGAMFMEELEGVTVMFNADLIDIATDAMTRDIEGGDDNE